MLQDEYRKLMDFFQQTLEGKPVNLEEICLESMQFFDKLKEQLSTGSESEKQETLRVMNEMHQKLVTECKKVTEKTGMTEDQLLMFSENPSNFSEEQWNILQETRRNMVKAGGDLVKILQTKAPEARAAASETGPLALKKEKKDEKKKIHKPKKSNWLRS